MTGRIATLLLAAGTLLAAGISAKADTIQLVNGDVVRGKVVSLNEKQLVFRSESFGEIKIDRTKVDLIALGTKGLPSTRQAAAPATVTAPAASGSGVGSLLRGIAPLLGSPTAQKSLNPMVEQLLGAGGVGDLQKNVDTARRGLQDLKKDLGSGPESQALDAYINLLNQFAPLSAAAGQEGQNLKAPKPPVRTPAPPRPAPPAKTPPPDKKSG